MFRAFSAAKRSARIPLNSTFVNTFFAKKASFFKDFFATLNIVVYSGNNNNMSDFKSVFNRNKVHIEEHPPKKPRYPEPISAKALKNIFDGCDDFQLREISPSLIGEPLAVCWLDGVVDGGAVSTEIIKPLTELLRAGAEPTVERLMQGAVYSAQAKERSDTDGLITDLTQACCAVIIGQSAVTFEIRTKNQRSISEPTIEKSLKGGKDSFVETLRTNTALVRKRICNPSLKVKNTTVGRKSETRCAVMYVDGVANPETVAELQRRLDRIDIDGLTATGSIEEYIVDNPRSPFPQLLHTERPDRFANQLLNGRVGLIVDSLPIAFMLPAGFADFMRVPQDDSQHFVVTSALSIVRWLALIFALALPAFYVAIAMYHQEMIPTQLLMSVIQSKQDVPFSTALEVLGMLIAFELLQEAGLRLPNPVGDTVSIIGALIVGQSAVDAKVISPIAVIVVAFAGISGFAMPSQDLGSALRVARLLLVLAAIGAGLFGVAALLCLIVWHLGCIDNFGVNYTAPLSGGRKHSLSRTVLRPPKPKNKLRDPELNTPDKRRQR